MLVLRYDRDEYPLTEGAHTVGRSATCNFVIDHPSVSRRHASFVVEADRVTIEDLGSRHGVSVNGRTLEGQHVLRAGDRVEIGGIQLLVSSDLGAATPSLRPLSIRPPSIAPSRLVDMPLSVFGELRHRDETQSSAALHHELLAICERAIDSFEFDEASRLLKKIVAGIVAAHRRSQKVESRVLDSTLRVVARLAEATYDSQWRQTFGDLVAMRTGPLESWMRDFASKDGEF